MKFMSKEKITDFFMFVALMMSISSANATPQMVWADWTSLTPNNTNPTGAIGNIAVSP